MGILAPHKLDLEVCVGVEMPERIRKEPKEFHRYGRHISNIGMCFALKALWQVLEKPTTVPHSIQPFTMALRASERPAVKMNTSSSSQK